jgi:hypothetical protein
VEKKMLEKNFEENLKKNPKIPENLAKNPKIPRKIAEIFNPKKSSYAFFRVIYPSHLPHLDWKFR